MPILFSEIKSDECAVKNIIFCGYSFVRQGYFPSGLRLSRDDQRLLTIVDTRVILLLEDTVDTNALDWGFCHCRGVIGGLSGLFYGKKKVLIRRINTAQRRKCE